MSYKKATYVALFGILILAVSFLFMAIKWEENAMGSNSSTIGAGYFPIILTTILIFLCLISFYQNWRKKEDQKIEIPNFKLILITVIAISLFLISWYTFGLFYLNLFLFFTALLLTFQGKTLFIKKILSNLLITSVVVLLIFVLFDYIIMLQF